MTFEAKKDRLYQTQDGIWKLTLTVLPEDMPIELLQAPMGTAYGLAMVKIDYDNPVGANNAHTEKTEGEKLVTRAAILCKDTDFQRYTISTFGELFVNPEQTACQWIYNKCEITSRSELATNKEAQEKFKRLAASYKEWLNPIDELYKDNLKR